VVEGLPKNHFYPQNDKSGCILPQFLTGRKRTLTRSLGTRILRFNRETKLTKTVQKLYKKNHGETKGNGRTIAPPWRQFVESVAITLGFTVNIISSFYNTIPKLDGWLNLLSSGIKSKVPFTRTLGCASAAIGVIGTSAAQCTCERTLTPTAVLDQLAKYQYL